LHLPCVWDDRHAPLCSAFIGWDDISITFAWAGLEPWSSLSSWDYRYEPPWPVRYYILKIRDGLLCSQ
jgi:hypothetical protein